MISIPIVSSTGHKVFIEISVNLQTKISLCWCLCWKLDAVLCLLKRLLYACLPNLTLKESTGPDHESPRLRILLNEAQHRLLHNQQLVDKDRS